MTAGPPTDLTKLLAAVRGARDPLSRLKLVATGAHTLAKLTPAQRAHLLRQLGLEGAEELAEAAVGGDPQLTAALTQTLRAIEADPKQVKGLLAAISDPKSRRETLMGLGAHVLDALTAPPPAPAPAAKPAVPPPAPKPTVPPPAPKPAAAPPRPSPAPPAATPPVAVPQPAPPPRPAPPPPVAPAPPPAPPAPPAPQEAATPPEAPAPAIALETPADFPPDSARPGTERGAASTLATLRVLRRALASEDGPSARAMATLLAQLQPDWARRRALAAFFAQGLPASLDEALELLERVEGAPGRRWALVDLARSRAWTEAEWERLLAAADSPSARRRLAARRVRA